MYKQPPNTPADFRSAALAKLEAYRAAKATKNKSIVAQAPTYALTPVLETKLKSNLLAYLVTRLPELATRPLNDDQFRAAWLASQGVSFCLIGPAGSGKTTTTRAIVCALEYAARVNTYSTPGHKYCKASDSAVPILAFTRRAAKVSNNAISDLGFKSITCHKFLEYAPVFEEYLTESGDLAKRKIFLPSRTSLNTNSPAIRTVIFDEASMQGDELHAEVLQSCPTATQFIYIGDIYQLPPVRSKSILAAKLTQLEWVELTKIYRQKEGSQIIDFAHAIKSNNPPSEDYLASLSPSKVNPLAGDELMVVQYKKSTKDWRAFNAQVLGYLFKLIDDGVLVLSRGDYILCPYRKAQNVSVEELNPEIANHFDRKLGTKVHEVIAMGRRSYWAVGDYITVDKEEAQIVSIIGNPSYTGKAPKRASYHLNRHGGLRKSNLCSPERLAQIESLEAAPNLEFEELDDDALGSHEITDLSFDSNESESALTHQASHIIKYKRLDALDDEDALPLQLKTAGEITALGLSYCQTVHQSQGGQAHTVVIIAHTTHRAMVNREILYTAVTRAQRHCIIITEMGVIAKGIGRAQIEGTTIKEKIANLRARETELLLTNPNQESE